MNTKEQAIIEDGGPAFHSITIKDGDNYNAPTKYYHKGMSLRDWFAGQERIDQSEDFGWPLPEVLAGPRPKGDWKTNPLEWFNWSNRWQAAVRYARADAMLERRKK